ncbi:TetR family transcriptional regulator [Primorskyibacter flagellatus]|uniref:TetR family transcriptional regulator n=1 Tax=Primorskyibacter flagellatus TaxID=1387277 RepID=A0A917A210_9RHOB|nr:TetR/AcrR family transcriptional regulator [Primorskyibacter flagellatus]GGE22750.1 TetR family transcriptional regulator [Primorskyibacter flagellatus]
MTQAAVPRSPGRPATFRRDDVVALAKDLFWTRGYRDVSLSEIAQAANLTRASVYNAFESKDAIFLEALLTYNSDAPAALLYDLPGETRVGDAFDRLFRAACRTMGGDPARRGCLAMNSFGELLAMDTPVTDTVKRNFEGSRRLMQALIARAVDEGELPAGTDAAATGNLILSHLAGLSTWSKSGATEEELWQMSRRLLDLIGFARPAD